MSARAQTVGRRVAAWFAITTIVSFAVLTLVSSELLRSAADRGERDAAEWWFDAARSLVLQFDEEPERLESTLEALLTIEAPPPEAFRIWDRASGELLREFDPRDYFEHFDELPRELGTSAQVDDGIAWHVGELDADRVLGAFLGVIDLEFAMSLESREPERVALIERYHGLLVWFLIASAVVALVVGWILGRRIGQELQRVRDERERTLLLTAGIAHELVAPVQNMIGQGDVTLRRERAAEEYRTVLESQVEEARSLGGVLENFIALSAPEALPDARPSDEIEVREWIDATVAAEAEAAARRDVRIEVDAAEGMRVRGDREALELALRNVLSNAIRFSPEGETVRVSASGEGKSVRVTVDDRGPGVPADEREVIFEPMRQGSPAPGQRVGHGLGLALAQRAAARHGGRIEVGDARGGGARFVIVLVA